MSLSLAIIASMLAVLGFGGDGLCATPIDYPVKPIRYIVPFPAGSGNDGTARAIAARLTETLGKQVVVDNRAGVGSIVAASFVVNAAPDGHTILMGSGSLTIAASMHDKLSYDVLRDLHPVTQIASFPSILVVHPSLPVTTVAELVKYAKSNPGKLNYGSSGYGGVGHLAMELFKSVSRIELVHVPYKSAGLALIDMASGQLQVMLTSVVTGMPQVRAGRVRLLAITSAKRSPMMPEIPTIAESGYSQYEVTQWFGVLVRSGTQREVIERLNVAIARIVHSPEIKAKLAIEGAEPVGNTSEQFGVFLRADMAKWSKVVKASGIRANEATSQ